MRRMSVATVASTVSARNGPAQLPSGDRRAFGLHEAGAGLDAYGILIASSIILRDRPICSSLGGKDSQVLLAN